MVDFPTNVQQGLMNDIPMYLKRFAIVTLAAYPSMSIFNWENPSKYPVTKATNILPSEDLIKQYISGVVVQANRNKIKEFV